MKRGKKGRGGREEVGREKEGRGVERERESGGEESIEDEERQEEWWRMVEEEQKERRKKRKAGMGEGEEKGDDLGEEGMRITGEEVWRKFEERRERMRKERERRELERKERERGEEAEKRRERRRNVVWRGVERGSAEERKRLIEGIRGRNWGEGWKLGWFGKGGGVWEWC